MSKVAIFFLRCLVIFTSLIANLTKDTATLQNEILTVLRFHHSLQHFTGVILYARCTPIQK